MLWILPSALGESEVAVKGTYAYLRSSISLFQRRSPRKAVPLPKSEARNCVLLQQLAPQPVQSHWPYHSMTGEAAIQQAAL